MSQSATAPLPTTTTSGQPAGIDGSPLVGPLQARVLEHVWSHGPCTVHQVVTAVNAALGRPMAYTTYLTVMRNLARRGLLEQREVGARAHRFSALVTREQYRAAAARHVVSVHFGGKLEALVAAYGVARG